MSTISRRDFLKTATALAAGLGCPAGLAPTPAAAAGQVMLPVPEIARGLERLAAGDVTLVWLQGQSCSGCSVSFLNAAYPDVASVITRYISLDFHPTLSTAAGTVARQALEARLAAGGYLLVAEGAVPVGIPQACHMGAEPFSKLLDRAARGAQAVIALGSCAAQGGIPAARPNPTGAVSVSAALQAAGVTTPIINLPGCPAHPDWLVGTLVYYLQAGPPPLTAEGCPALFYSDIIHTRCPQFYNYNMGEFAARLGEAGCLFKLGCQGIRTKADCATRPWNTGVNWCIGAGAPCIGCVRPEFARDPDYPFYRIREAG